MALPKCDVDFLTGPFQNIEGWCIDDAAWLTAYLLRYQQSKGRLGPSFEIGVYWGKYLSVLQHCARDRGMEVLGFDTYEWVKQQAVEEKLASVFGDLTGLRLIQGDSTKMTPEILNEHLAGKPAAFISIDGAHTTAAVLSDLLLSEQVVAPWGIVAIDDFLNAMAIGVTDGAMRYWHTTPATLVPFCFCRNKLFAAPAAYADEYSDQVLQCCEENAHMPAFHRMLENKKKGLHWAKQGFTDRDIWII